MAYVIYFHEKHLNLNPFVGYFVFINNCSSDMC